MKTLVILLLLTVPAYDGKGLPAPGDIANSLIEGICKQDAAQVERVLRKSTTRDIDPAALASMLSHLSNRSGTLVEGQVINKVTFMSLPPKHGYTRMLAAKNCWRKYKDGTDSGWLIQVKMYFGEGGVFEGFEAREDEIKQVPKQDKIPI